MANGPAACPTLFQEGRLSLGLVLPIRRGEGLDVDFAEQVDLAVRAEALGFAAVWVRDVPLNGPWYPEAFGHSDPMVMLGAIAARTSRIAIGSAAIVLTLRHPLHIAKAAISLDRLSGGRFVLGLGSGNRREEFAAFGADPKDHKELYRDHWTRLAAALERPPRILAETPDPEAAFEIRPAAQNEVPMLAIGSGGQTLEWIARNAAGWATYHRPPPIQRDRYGLWRRAVDRVAPGAFRSFSVAVRIELLADAAAPASAIDLGYRTGVRELRAILETMREAGTHHVLLNLPPTGAPPAENLARIAEEVLPALR